MSQAAAEPESQTDVLRHVRRIDGVPTDGPAWPQQRNSCGRLGHPVERHGQRALFNVAPKPKLNSSPAAPRSNRWPECRAEASEQAIALNIPVEDPPLISPQPTEPQVPNKEPLLPDENPFPREVPQPIATPEV